ncbi:pyridoxine 5'-phosphate synthase [Rubritalea sp.]|uniref:pyridoxine 5'-phosphate synthase n=1 Tax=Rubritalea sp. TaxID=2109375 RepID=UPI003EF7C628
MSLLLGVNIDHVATLRQARYALLPDSPNAEPSPVGVVEDAKAGGADSITIHVRVDRRHMQDADAFAVKEQCDLPLNLEMGNTQEMLELALKIQPEFVCLVPETREEVTTEGGLDVAGLFDKLKPTVEKLQAAGIKISMFIDPDVEQVEASAKIGAEMVELHTGCFANAFGEQRQKEVARLTEAAVKGHELGVQVNAGHGINYTNIVDLYDVPHFVEFNIGHSIVARSVKVGFQQAVAEMVELMKGYRG